MTGAVVNLRQARKRRVRAVQKAAAEENRAAHGQSKAQKEAVRAETKRAAARLEEHRRDST